MSPFQGDGQARSRQPGLAAGAQSALVLCRALLWRNRPPLGSCHRTKAQQFLLLSQMLSLCPLCPEKLKPPREQTNSITLPLNWGSPASPRRHYHLVNTLCIGFPGKPRGSVHGVWKSKPSPQPSGAQGPLSCTQVAPSWSLPQCMVTFSSRASPACSVGLWLARTSH